MQLAPTNATLALEQSDRDLEKAMEIAAPLFAIKINTTSDARLHEADQGRCVFVNETNQFYSTYIPALTTHMKCKYISEDFQQLNNQYQKSCLCSCFNTCVITSGLHPKLLDLCSMFPCHKLNLVFRIKFIFAL